VFSVARSSTAQPNDYGAVAVIDGSDLKLTPLRSANIPPPMALYEVNVSHNISDVAFSSNTSSIAILHQGGIAIYSWEINSTSSSPPALSGRATFKDTLGGATPQQICFNEVGDILTLDQTETSTPSLQRYSFSKETGRVEEKIVEAGSFSSPLMISSFGQDGLTYLYAQGASGVLLSLSLPSFGQPLITASFPMFLPWVEIITFADDKIAFGMSKNGHLYANSRLLVKNCTSFLVTPFHLIFTTTNHLLKFVHIAKIEGLLPLHEDNRNLLITLDLEIPPDDPEVDERCRSIERGARLVTAMPTSLSLVLQMPRGNLETIWPRAMVLAGIRKLIDEKNYRNAFLHCRTQRVDMNILYDHAPEQFMANVGTFVDQIKKVSYIDLFLSSLRFVF
jgi:elongator complex protein 1